MQSFYNFTTSMKFYNVWLILTATRSSCINLYLSRQVIVISRSDNSLEVFFLLEKIWKLVPPDYVHCINKQELKSKCLLALTSQFTNSP